MAVKVAVVALAATVTEPGTVRTLLLLESATEAPPVGAAADNVTVQVAVVFEARLAGEHWSDETLAAACGGATVIEAVLELPLSEAVIVAVTLAVTVPVVAVNVAVLEPAGTSTEAETATALLPLDSPTEEPPAGAACDSVTVQLEVPPDVTAVGEHCKEETVIPACGGLTVTDAERELAL